MYLAAVHAINDGGSRTLIHNRTRGQYYRCFSVGFKSHGKKKSYCLGLSLVACPRYAYAFDGVERVKNGGRDGTAIFGGDEVVAEDAAPASATVGAISGGVKASHQILTQMSSSNPSMILFVFLLCFWW